MLNLTDFGILESKEELLSLIRNLLWEAHTSHSVNMPVAESIQKMEEDSYKRKALALVKKYYESKKISVPASFAYYWETLDNPMSARQWLDGEGDR